MTYSKLPAYRVFNGNGHTSNYSGCDNLSRPAINIIESKDAFRIEMAAPGLSKSDFNIEVENGELKISGFKKVESQESETFLKKEFNFNDFERNFTIPDTVNTDGIEAKYNAGILSVNIPKKEEFKVKPPREISVN